MGCRMGSDDWGFDTQRAKDNGWTETVVSVVLYGVLLRQV